MTAAYDRALASEPQLCDVERLVDQLCKHARPGDYERYGHMWEWIVKALVSPLVGDERGLIPRQVGDEPSGRFISMADFMDLAAPGRYTTPTSETEKWMRGSEAFDAVMNELRSRLAGAGSSGE
ncbi:MAG: hypothetical protein ACRDSP_03195 [Pseudonocardiaceae bacterium]